MRDIRVEARVNTFDEVAGNKDNIRTIKSILNSSRFPIGLFFIGDFGCGKSALARLVAKVLLCANPEQGKSDPCCKCPSCLWFQSGAGIFAPWGYRELNCAEEQSYDVYKKIFYEARYHGAPFGAPYSITLFDEFQRSTQPIRDMFLNVLENLSTQTRFIFTAGADLQKDPDALAKIDKAFFDRVTTISMEIPSKEEIILSLKKILPRLGVNIDNDVFTLLTDYSRVPREYLGLLDKASFISNHISKNVLLAVLPKEAK